MCDIATMIQEHDALVAHERKARAKARLCAMLKPIYQNISTLKAISIMNDMSYIWGGYAYYLPTLRMWYDEGGEGEAEVQMLERSLFLHRRDEKVWRMRFRVRMNANDGYAMSRLFDSEAYPLNIKLHSAQHEFVSITELPDGRWEMQFDYYDIEQTNS